MKKIVLVAAMIIKLVAQDEQEIFLEKHSKQIDKYKRESSMNQEIDIKRFNVNMSVDDKINDEVKEDMKKIKKDKSIEEFAQKDSKVITTKEFKSKLQDAKEHLLYDKKLNWSEQALIAKNHIQNSTDSDNFYSNSSETIYIILSSSVPKQTILNYLESTKHIQSNVVFVLQGSIGGLQKIMPTLDWIKELLGDKYLSAKFIIDPKLPKHFNIKQVPALVYTQKNLYELQSEQLHSQSNQFGDTYIFYGDMPIKYMLEQLNNKKENQFISHLIKQLETK
ncbi:MAG: TrbC family F-type conjugative pilus assembly protein [Arcobacteraceae bacterium]|jgi:type-F conjugative transfer system pilin assembly protein TrbC